MYEIKAKKMDEKREYKKKNKKNSEVIHSI